MNTYPFKLVAKNDSASTTVVRLSDEVSIGCQDKFTVIAGPCAVESEEQLVACAYQLKNTGVNILRGGAFKPRTSPYSFRGLGKKALILLARIKKETGLKIITELLYIKDIEDVTEVADIIQIGSRNMQNYELLEEVGKLTKPVLLKRGFSNTIEELLLSAEYIMLKGNTNIILCERGIRTFEKYTRNTLDISAVPIIKQISHLPVIVDPSHACGKQSLVPSLSLSAVAAGADGIIVEVHPDPSNALCDGVQSLDIDSFKKMYQTIKSVALVLGKSLN
ncbi:MAG: 3-deoxy-7-phosphoheptulonate synthase [Planctomycetota bacterium]